jgi:hypothetical protein
MGGMNPYLFIVGCPRSGTTMLRRIVDAHPEIAMLPETHWIPRLARNGVGIGPDGLVTEELVDWLGGYFRFPRMKLDPAEVRALVEPGATYPEFVAALFDLYGRKRGKRLVAEKTPNYVAEIATLNALFPKARFVHLIRDGRDVALSAMDRAKKPLTAGQVARRWKRRITKARRQSRKVNHYLEARYEDLVTDPPTACKRLLDFAGLAPHAAFDAALARTPFRADRLDAYRRQLDAASLAALDASLADHLRRWGYG